MSDRMLEAATRRLAELRAEMAEIERFVETYRKLEAAWFGAKQEPHAPDLRADTALYWKHSFRHMPRRVAKSELLASAALEQIEDAERPLPLGELADRLNKAGVEIGGADPRANLSAHLNNSGVLVSLRGHGWWPRAKPYVPAGYDPDKPEKDEAASTTGDAEELAASIEAPNDAERRGEVAHDIAT